ncbi:hypothetical protein ACW0TN_10570, partial [Fusobacterium pseudoperiodonticum]
KNQKLDFEYKTLFGSSNSARNGFVPLLKEMSKDVQAKNSSVFMCIVINSLGRRGGKSNRKEKERRN